MVQVHPQKLHAFQKRKSKILKFEILSAQFFHAKP